MGDINFKRVLSAGLAINFVSFFVGGGSYFLFDWIFELEPSYIWKWTPKTGLNMSINWWIRLLFMNTIGAIIIALIFAILYKGIPGKGFRKGIIFGIIVWIVGPIPALATLYLLVNISFGALIYFTIQSLFEWSVYGTVISVIYRENINKNT